MLTFDDELQTEKTNTLSQCLRMNPPHFSRLSQGKPQRTLTIFTIRSAKFEAPNGVREIISFGLIAKPDRIKSIICLQNSKIKLEFSVGDCLQNRAAVQKFRQLPIMPREACF